MTHRATFTLEDETFSFLKATGGGNRSAYINRLLKAEQQRLMEAAILKANQEEAEDPHYQEELALWDVAVADGLSG